MMESAVYNLHRHSDSAGLGADLADFRPLLSLESDQERHLFAVEMHRFVDNHGEFCGNRRPSFPAHL